MTASHSRARQLHLDGRPVHYRVVSPQENGAGAVALRLPLLLLHGLGCSTQTWEPALRGLEQQRLDQPVYAPDMPGYGRSPGPPTALGMTALADWSARFLDQLALDRVHAAGNSMGCQVAIALAHRHPERVGAMVLVGATTGSHDATLSRYLIGLLLDGARESFRYNSTLTRTYLRMGVRRYLATVRQMIQDETLAAAGAVAAPTLVLRGEADAIVSEARSRRLATALPRGAFLTIPGAAHALQFTRPDSYVPITVAFLAGAEAGSQNLWGTTSSEEAAAPRT